MLRQLKEFRGKLTYVQSGFVSAISQPSYPTLLLTARVCLENCI